MDVAFGGERIGQRDQDVQIWLEALKAPAYPGRIDVPLAEALLYNTHHYSQGNQGHAFAAVLSEGERRALVEYLKTL